MYKRQADDGAQGEPLSGPGQAGAEVGGQGAAAGAVRQGGRGLPGCGQQSRGDPAGVGEEVPECEYDAGRAQGRAEPGEAPAGG